MAAISASMNSVVVKSGPGFGSLLQSEWTKLRSVRSTWVMVALAVGLSVGFSALIALVTGLTHDSWNEQLRSQFDPILNTMGGWLFGMILVIVIGVTSVTSEYNSRMVRTTFIVSPRRTRVFAAKALVVALLGMAISAVVIPGMLFVAQPIYGHYGLETARITDSEVIRYLLVAGLLQGVFHALIPFSIAWLLRGPATAITVSIGFSVLPWMLAPVVPLWVQENVFRYLPDNAKDALIGVLKPDAATYLGQTSAIIVIAVWIAGLLAVAAIVLNRRDI